MSLEEIEKKIGKLPMLPAGIVFFLIIVGMTMLGFAMEALYVFIGGLSLVVIYLFYRLFKLFKKFRENNK